MKTDVSYYEVVICKGLPASGKSTWAKKQAINNHVKRINKDDLRAMIDSSTNMDYNESFICHCRNMILKASIENGLSVIIDDTNLNPCHENTIRSIVDSCDSKYTIRIETFDIDLLECIRRNSLRSGKSRVPVRVILEMYNSYIKDPKDPDISTNEIPEGTFYGRDSSFMLRQDETLQNAIICDLDGTLSIMHNRSPFAEHGCINDNVNEPVKDVLEWAKSNGISIILLSGRNGRQLEETKEWLIKNNIPYDALHMRPVGDNRKDSDLKYQMFNDYIKDNYFVKFVMDDRDQVVDLWRQKVGVACFQVNYGDF
jgi:predicted kinase